MKLLNRLSPGTWFGGALLFAFVLLLFALEEHDPNTVAQEDKTTETAQRASVVELAVAPHQKLIRVKGVLAPKSRINIRARVSGLLLELPEYAVEGALIKQGQLLAYIDDSEYRRDVLEARSQLLQARLHHDEDLDKVRIKRDEWKSVASRPPGERALNIPQTEASRLKLQSAQNNLKVAERRLANTRIEAPYDLLIVKRFMEGDQRVDAGTDLFEVRSADNQIVVDVSKAQFTQLADDWKAHSLSYKGLVNDAQSRALFRSGGNYLDSKTRKYRLYLTPEVQSPQTSGSYVYVDFPGKRFERALSVPESSVSREGYVWTVTQDNHLQRHKARILDTLQRQYIIAAPSSQEYFRVVRYPLARLLDGDKVAADNRSEANAG